MTLCAGCNRQADKVFKGNESLGLCIPCSRFLPTGSGNTYLLKNLPSRECVACDGPVHHGGMICVGCRNDVIKWMVRKDSTLLDDNPFIYELAYPGICFNQYIANRESVIAPDILWVAIDDMIGLKKISFTGIVYKKENSA